jgi:hypothetical protein
VRCSADGGFPSKCFYGFAVVDYSYYGMPAYTVLAGTAAEACAAAIGCCRDAWRCAELSEEARSSFFSRTQVIEGRINSLAMFV